MTDFDLNTLSPNKIFPTRLSIKVETTEEELSIDVSALVSSKIPKNVSQSMEYLMLKMPIIIRNGWLFLILEYPDIESGFKVMLHFNFYIDEDGDWATHIEAKNPDSVEAMLLGMAKLVLSSDPIVDELMEITND
ncbi:hypothetical protein FHQ28_08615 [Pasteurellaceae bacterium USgator11]|nr:hypothetical protein FHQ20_11650 [Pasteurellaceae bacterium USgator41]TNG98684.1 hypothetical protein FHQ24_07825 [Pasteurellaceae bacterium UScroc31]TNH00051.1 hypothetical protein FHQ28_08615 [Pasteurellaceae bacterium USgator11]